MDILYQDDRIVVAVKPWAYCPPMSPGRYARSCSAPSCTPTASAPSTGWTPRCPASWSLPAAVWRAALLSQQIRERRFTKEYLAVLCGTPSQPSGILTDLLARDPQRRLTYVADTPSPSAREARLSFAAVDSSDGMTLVRVRLHTGRTHQIRVQFASRGLPLAGDRKYGASDAPYPIALWSCRLSFVHPQTGEPVTFTCPPPDTAPWDLFTLPEML